MKEKLINYLNFKHLFLDFVYSETENFDDSFGVLYKNDKVLISDLSDEFKMFYVINNIDCEDCEQLDDFGACGATKISKDELKNKYHNLLGKNTDANIVEFDYNSSSWIDLYDDYVLYGNCGGDTYGYGYFINTEFNDVEINNNEIYLYENVMFSYTDDGEKYNIYSDINYNNLIANDMQINNKDFSNVFNNYSDKLAQYKYTFKLEDGNYIFYSVEKVK